MKLKVLSVTLLLVAFLYLSFASGTLPVRAAEPAALAALSSEELGQAIASLPEATATPLPAPEETPIPAPTPSPTETPRPTAEPSSVAVIATTITSDSMLDNDTGHDIDPQALLAQGPALSLPSDGYQILIIHTHGTEAYTPDGADVYEESDEYRTTDTNYSVVQVGEALKEALEAYGLNVLHDEGLYDYPSYTSSYVRSGEAIEEYLEAYPGIAMVIDLHRDALGEGDTIYKTITTAEGVQSAQLMFVMGSDVNLEHPFWQENLTLALTLQQAANDRFPNLMRPTNVCAYRYNQQLTAGSILMEVGTAGNTLQEAITAVKLFADAVGPQLVSYIEPA